MMNAANRFLGLSTNTTTGGLPLSGIECIPDPTEADNYVAGERALWRAVILQALTDAGTTSIKPEAKQEKIRALRWLLGNSEDFATVCLNAGYSPDYVREQAIRALQRGCAWRKPDISHETKTNIIPFYQTKRLNPVHHYGIAANGKTGGLPLHCSPVAITRA